MSSRYTYDLDVVNDFVSTATNFNCALLETNTIDTDTAGVLTIGASNATQIDIGQVGVVTNVLGGFSITGSILPAELFNLTSDEITQLQNIDTTTISTAQWGYIGSADQSLATTADATFNKLTVSAQGSNIPINTQLIVATDTITNTSEIVWVTTVEDDVVINLPDTASMPMATTRAYRILIFNKSPTHTIVLTGQNADVINGSAVLNLKKNSHVEIVNTLNTGWVTI